MDLAEVRVLIHQGCFLRGLRAAEDLADRQDRPYPERMAALCLACQAASTLGIFRKATEHAARARGMAETAGDGELLARTRYLMGRAALDSGDWHTAEENLLAFLADLDIYPALAAERLQAEFALAATYEGLRRTEAALGLYRRVAEGAGAHDRLSLAVMARQNAAWLLLLAGRTEEAAQHLADCAAIMGTAPGLQVHQLVLTAFVHLRCGRYPDAIEMCEEVLVAERPGVSDWDRAAAAWVAGMAALDLGQTDIGRSLAALATRYSPGARDTRLMNLVTDLNRRLRGSGAE